MTFFKREILPFLIGFSLPLIAIIAGITLAQVDGQDAPKLPLVKDAAQPMPKGKAEHARGHKPPPAHIAAARHRVSNAKHGAMLLALKVATQATYDARITGWIPPPGDQNGCGDCYLHSGVKTCACAQVAGGIIKPSTTNPFMLSVQEMLDCHGDLGGCGGGDEYSVAQAIQSSGVCSMADYAGPGSSPGNCQSVTGKTLYTVTNLVFADPAQTNQGVASTQSIKNAILAYGYVSVAGAAGGWSDPGQNGTITGNDNSIDHAIGLVGWDDTHDNGDGSKGAWVMQNQWGQWGGSCANSAYPTPTPAHSIGYAWIKYGADSIGTEAFIAIAGSGPTPVPPTPVPPTPIPPVPPVPPVPNGTLPTPGTTSQPGTASFPVDFGLLTVQIPQGWIVAGGNTMTTESMIRKDLATLPGSEIDAFVGLYNAMKAKNKPPAAVMRKLP
jgi:C1A family cysteine protease